MKPISVDDISAMRMEGDLREALHAIQEDAKARCERNRRLVLAHPDLAARLTAPPCSFTRPEVWTGFIAPKYLGGRFGEAVLNDSPYRAQLVALVAEAEQRTTRKDTAA